MNLSWKDLGTTILTGGVIALATGAVQQWASFISNRWAIAGMMVLGIVECMLGSYDAGSLHGWYAAIIWSLVGLSTVGAALGFIYGTKTFVVLVAAALALLWLVSTLRHTFPAIAS